MKSCVLSIAGFDPSGGAGVLADVRTFVSHGLDAFGCVSAITFQNEREFIGVEWLPYSSIQAQVESLYSCYSIDALKIGLVENLCVLRALILDFKRYFPRAPIVWDPIMQASAGFVFHDSFVPNELDAVLDLITVVTPNTAEALRMCGQVDPIEAARLLAKRCSVILKGGHAEGILSEDIVFSGHGQQRISVKRLIGAERHGTGCVYSASVAARLALGDDIASASRVAQRQVVDYLESHSRNVSINNSTVHNISGASHAGS